MNDFKRHDIEIQKNLAYWEHKPVLRTIYDNFYSLITSHLNQSINGKTIEIGSGIGNLKKYIPQCICTDAFSNPWIDQVENAYKLSFEDNEASNIILFDVWHHLEFPVLALKEFQRVLKKQGHIIIFEPYISFLGWVVYSMFHSENVSWFRKININDNAVDINNLSYYAAQGNATRFFLQKKYKAFLTGFSIQSIEKKAAIAYVLSGGYSKKQLFPDKYYPIIRKFETYAATLPFLCATRLLVVLTKI